MLGERTSFYLSYNELLFVCDLCCRNCLVFASGGGYARFLGGVTHHGSTVPILVSLQAANHVSRVRSHFQRLILSDDVKNWEKKLMLRAQIDQDRLAPVTVVAL